VIGLTIVIAKRPVARDPAKSLDLVTCVDGMFRILDLVSEQGSGGLGINIFSFKRQVCLTCVLNPVDKIIIAQPELSQFINELAPGAYRSLTKVDYNDLDRIPVRPLGVYGSKSEIVRFLRSLNAINGEMWVVTTKSKANGLNTILCSARNYYLLHRMKPLAFQHQFYGRDSTSFR
jgi:hypothetical protein